MRRAAVSESLIYSRERWWGAGRLVDRDGFKNKIDSEKSPQQEIWGARVGFWRFFLTKWDWGEIHELANLCSLYRLNPDPPPSPQPCQHLTKNDSLLCSARRIITDASSSTFHFYYFSCCESHESAEWCKQPYLSSQKCRSLPFTIIIAASAA